MSVGVTLFAYEGQSERELSFKQGEIVFISKEDDGGWWEGEANGNFGFFPTNYVKKIMSLKKDAPLPQQPLTNMTAPMAEESLVAEPVAEPTLVEAEPVVAEVTPKKSAPSPASRSKSGTSTGSGSGSSAGSKQKFLTDLEDLKKVAQAEQESNAKLQALVDNLSKEIELLKHSTGSSGSSNAGPGDSNLSSQVQELSSSTAKLELQMDQATNDLASIKKTLEALKTEEIGLKRDLKIIQFKCDKNKASTETVRRAAPVLNKP